MEVTHLLACMAEHVKLKNNEMQTAEIKVHLYVRDLISVCQSQHEKQKKFKEEKKKLASFV